MVFRITGDFIKLGQILKAVHLVEIGSDAKDVILNGEVCVNGETETRRGKKLVHGDVVEFNGEVIEVI